MKIISVLCFVIIILPACSQNKKSLNTNEQKLAAQIAVEEKEKIVEEMAKESIEEIPDTFPPGFRFQEVRSVDPNKPPEHLDVIGTQQNIREFKLSDFASSIKYIKLQTPPDSTLVWSHPKLDLSDFSVFSNDKYIFVKWTFGLARFNMGGNFQELIWKNKSGIESGDYGFNFSPGELNGISPLHPVSTFNDDLYIRFTDGRNNQIQFVKQNINEGQTLNLSLQDVEAQPESIPGKKMGSIKGSVFDRSFETIFGLTEKSWAGIQDTYKSAESGSVITVFSDKGDTLCQFSSAHQLKTRTNPLVTANKPFTWNYKNNLTFLEQYTDTIFRIIPPNRMLPTYVLNFGKKKVSLQEGLDTRADLSQKLLPYSIFETNKYLFIRYTKNSAGLRNRRNGTVRFYNSVFEKSGKQFYHFPNSSSEVTNMQNDLDGGIPFWPEFVTPEGKMFMTISGKMLKEHIGSADFKNAEISNEQKQKQIAMANAIKDSDKVVVVVN